MNNKKGGVGAKILLVLILMIASAVAGAYGYRVLDGKWAAKDATKDIERVDTSEYDSLDANEIEDMIKEATTDLEAAKSREEVYEILTDFNKDLSKIKTSAEKEAIAAQQNPLNQPDTQDQNNNFVTPNDDEDDNSGGFSLFGTSKSDNN